MGITWQDIDQKAFFDNRADAFNRANENGSLRESFWPKIAEEWFATWPLPAPTAEEIQKMDGNVAKAEKALRNKKLDVSAVYRRLVRT